MRLSLNLPHQYTCPLSRKLFENPVKAVDGYTYRKKAILHWFEDNKLSPMTYDELDNKTLKDNRKMVDDVSDWRLGKDIPKPRKKRSQHTTSTASTMPAVSIRFIAPNNEEFTREVKSDSPRKLLYSLAFRGMRGLFKSFTLCHGEQRLMPSYSPINQLVHDQEATIVIYLKQPQ